MKRTPQPPPSALTPAPFDHAMLALHQYVRLSQVIRLGYSLPEADFAAMLDQIELHATRIVLDALQQR